MFGNPSVRQKCRGGDAASFRRWRKFDPLVGQGEQTTGLQTQDRSAIGDSRREGRRLARFGDTLVVDGIGGSALGALAIQTALRPRRRLVILDNVDPEGVAARRGTTTIAVIDEELALGDPAKKDAWPRLSKEEKIAKLHSLAQALLEHESLDGEEIARILAGTAKGALEGVPA